MILVKKRQRVIYLAGRFFFPAGDKLEICGDRGPDAVRNARASGACVLHMDVNRAAYSVVAGCVVRDPQRRAAIMDNMPNNYAQNNSFAHS